MAFVLVGVVLIALNLLGIGFPANWNWQIFGDLWKFVLPFILAVAWWGWSDKSGRDKRREMARMDAKKEKRRSDSMRSLGVGTPDDRKKR